MTLKLYANRSDARTIEDIVDKFGLALAHRGTLLGDDLVVDLRLDITACHLNGTPLDLKKLLGFDVMSLSHDIMGIRNNLNRITGKLENNFLPKCALPQPQMEEQEL